MGMEGASLAVPEEARRKILQSLTFFSSESPEGQTMPRTIFVYWNWAGKERFPYASLKRIRRSSLLPFSL